MLFYYCSNRTVQKPDPLVLKPARDPFREDNPPVIPALYANSEPQWFYGVNAHEFTLRPFAKVLDMSNKMYLLMRHDIGYRAGLFDAAKRAGYVALRKKQSEGDTSLVVLNFDFIEGWKLSENKCQ